MGRRGAEAARGDDVTENLKFREINNSLGRFQDEMVEYDTAIGLAVCGQERHEIFGETVNIVLIFSDLFRGVDEYVLHDPGKESGAAFAALRDNNPL